MSVLTPRGSGLACPALNWVHLTECVWGWFRVVHSRLQEFRGSILQKATKDGETWMEPEEQQPGQEDRKTAGYTQARQEIHVKSGESKHATNEGGILLKTYHQLNIRTVQFSSVQSFSRVRLFAMPWTAAGQVSLSITNSWSLLTLMSIESVMPSNHLILCHPLLLPSSILPSIRGFSNESALRIRWPKYWSFSFNISPSSEFSGLISFRRDWLDLLAVQGTLKSLLQTILWKHQFFRTQLSL